MGCWKRLPWLAEHRQKAAVTASSPGWYITQVAGVSVCGQLHTRTHAHVYTYKYKSYRNIISWSVAKNSPTPSASPPGAALFSSQGTKSGFPSALAQTRQLLYLNTASSDNSVSLPGIHVGHYLGVGEREKRGREEPVLGENCASLQPLKLVSWKSRGAEASCGQGGCFHSVLRSVYFFISLFTEVFVCAG